MKRPFGRGLTLLRGPTITMGINHLLNGMILQVPLFLLGISIHLPLSTSGRSLWSPSDTIHVAFVSQVLRLRFGETAWGLEVWRGGPQKHTIQTPHLHPRRYDWKIRECVTWKFSDSYFYFPLIYAEHIWNRSQHFLKFMEFPEQNSPTWSKIHLKPWKISSKYRKKKTGGCLGLWLPLQRKLVCDQLFHIYAGMTCWKHDSPYLCIICINNCIGHNTTIV